ncbi:MAG TPA: four helix bundle protein [Anaerolineae bacterium]|nr:four helix bundle protein [Anaerolineae bacterium]
MASNIRHYRELDVYKMAIEAAMGIFELTKWFPAEERYSLTDQVRRSSRSVCANIAEAWRKRRYANAFVAKLSDAEAEAAETEVWLELAVRCGYLDATKAAALEHEYEHILGKLVTMISHPDQWTIRTVREEGAGYDASSGKLGNTGPT